MTATSTARETAKPAVNSGLCASQALRKKRAIQKLRDYMKAEDITTIGRKSKFAKALHTTPGQLNQIVQGNRPISAWLAVNLDRVSSGALPMDEMCVETNPAHAIDWDHVRLAMRRKKAKV